MTLTVGSLFSGIGGLDLGLERAGMQVVWQCEKDPYARKVLSKHWPTVHCYEDVRHVHGTCFGVCPISDGDTCFECVPRVDVLCGGFPCQDISNAGKRAGINGSRSGLWSEYARLVNELRPTWVIIENVPALRSRGLGRVLSDLSASGYDAEWDGISAAHVGAPHRRDRIWVAAYPKREPIRVEPGRSGGAYGQGPLVFGRDDFEGALANADCQRELQPQGSVGALGGWVGNCGEHVADANLPGLEVGREQSAREERHTVERGCLSDDPWAVEPDVGRVAHGISFELDLAGVGSAKQINGKKTDAKTRELVWRLLRAVWEHQEIATPSPDLYGRRLRDSLPEMPYRPSYGRWYLGQRLKEDEGLRNLWAAFYAAPFYQEQNMQQRLLERIGQIERSKTLGRVDRLRCLGNAVVPQVAELIGRLVVQANEVSHV